MYLANLCGYYIFFHDDQIRHVECTTSVMQALISFKQLHPGYREKEIENSVAKAVCYLENTQWKDGSW